MSAWPSSGDACCWHLRMRGFCLTISMMRSALRANGVGYIRLFHGGYRCEAQGFLIGHHLHAADRDHLSRWHGRRLYKEMTTTQ
jgi:hypothetical protein